VLRVVFRAALTVLAACAPLVCDDIDPAALLNRARAKIVGNIGRLPKYTCLQTVHRSRYERFPRMRVTGCGHVEDAGAAAESEPMLAWADRLKLDVTVSGGTEIFSWAGAHHFETENVEKIVGSGLTGTGDFGSFLMNTFGTNGPKYEYLGVALQTGGRQLAVYRYQVPLEASGYQFKTGSSAKDLVRMPYEGKFWIDSENAELKKMTIEVPRPPREAQTCRVATTIDYQQQHIGGSDFLMPRLTVLDLWTPEGERHENRIEYAACREFQTESVFRTDLEPTEGTAVVAQKPVTIPTGVHVKIALRSKVDLDNAFAGDAIEGRLLNPIAKVVAAGALVRGRIVRLEYGYQPSNYVAVGVKFRSIEVHGSEMPLSLVAVMHKKTSLAGPMETREGIGIYIFQNDRVVLDEKFVSEWKTTARREQE
jgi:hypothetical protein